MTSNFFIHTLNFLHMKTNLNVIAINDINNANNSTLIRWYKSDKIANKSKRSIVAQLKRNQYDAEKLAKLVDNYPIVNVPTPLDRVERDTLNEIDAIPYNVGDVVTHFVNSQSQKFTTSEKTNGVQFTVIGVHIHEPISQSYLMLRETNADNPRECLVKLTNKKFREFNGK